MEPDSEKACDKMSCLRDWEVKVKKVFSIFLLFMAIEAFAADKTITVQVKGLSCPICAGAVEKQIKKIPGVKSVKIHLSQGRATVVADETVPNEKFIEAVTEAGFTPGDIEKVESSK